MTSTSSKSRATWPETRCQRVWRTCSWRRSLRPLTSDREIRTYFGVLLGSIAVIAVLLAAHNVYDSFPEALRASAFHVVSLATTTGYSATDYSLWPVFAPVLLLFLVLLVLTHRLFME